MRRISALVLVIVLCGVMVAQAQEQTPEPTTDAITVIATQSAETLERAESLIATANQQIDTMFNFISLLLAGVALVITVTGVLAAIFGYFGVRQFIDNRVNEAIANIAQTAQQTVIEKIGQTEKAVVQQSEQATRALALLPIGERQYLVQDYSGALQTYQRALELHNDNAVIHYHIGVVHMLMNDLPAAEIRFDSSIALDDRFLPARAARGYIIRRQGETLPAGTDRDKAFDEAARILNSVLEQSHYLVDIDGQSWWGALGSLYRKQGKLDRAIDAYTEAARVTPFSSYPFSNLALLYGQKGDIAQMETHYERVERLSYDRSLIEPNNFWWYTDLLASRLALGRKQADIDRALQDMLVTRPQDSLYPVGNLVRALRRLLSIVPDDRKAAIITVIQRIETDIPAIIHEPTANGG